MTRLVQLAAAIALALSAAGCDESLSDFTGPTPNLEPTFSSIQRNIFEAADSAGRPACISCHNLGNSVFTGGLNLSTATAYAGLVNQPSTLKAGAVRVIAGDPDNSYLIRKLEGAPDIFGDRMPQFGPYLTTGQIAVIRRWIELGAAND
jgi:hypothetical protein